MSGYISIVLTEIVKLNRDLGFSPPKDLVLNKRSGDKILIIPGPGIVVGLEVGNDASAPAVTDSLRPLVKRITVG